MATMATMALLHAKCLSISSPRSHLTPTLKPTAMRATALSLVKGLGVSLSQPCKAPTPSPALLAGAVFSALSASDAAFAAQQIADVAEGDNRGLALLLPLIPAILWVLYNILQPALNQLNRMRSEKGLVVGLGIGGGLAAAGLAVPDGASAAGELAAVAVAEASSDSRGLLLLFVVAPAIAWVLYNILQPALNQINRMRSG